MEESIEELERLDREVLRAMRTRAHLPALEAGARALATSGEYGAVWFAGGLFAAATDRPRRKRWLIAAALAPCAIVINFGFKLLVKRPRPTLRGLAPLGGAPSSLSFPSAHATASFAAATAMSRIEPRARVPLFGLAIAMGLTRPYLGMHYPTDVLAGAALGTAIGNLAPVGRDPVGGARGGAADEVGTWGGPTP